MADNAMITFGYIKESEINQGLATGKLARYSIVYTSDTHTQFLIDENLTPIEIKSRVSVFNSVEEANDKLNKDSTTYVGQIVSISNGNYYQAYSVQNKDGKYYVKAVHDPNDYAQLTNKPIELSNGTTENPIILSDLADGIYMVQGVFYAPGETNTTTTLIGKYVAIESVGTLKYITQISSNSIEKYIIDGNKVTKENYITDTYLESKGYATSTDVKNIVKEEVDIAVNKAIDNKFVAFTEDEIRALFLEN